MKCSIIKGRTCFLNCVSISDIRDSDTLMNSLIQKIFVEFLKILSLF